MVGLKLKQEAMCWSTSGAIAALAVALTISALARQQGEQTFPTSLDAANALVTAIEKDDQQAVRQILGPDSQSVIASGDDAEDRESRANFVRKYREMHRFVPELDGTTVLYIGAENWPMPIPLVNRAGSWFFDADAGKNEILYRKIGQNELDAIEVCHELVNAQNEYYDRAKQYAPRFVSDANKQDGLYWPASASGNESPIGPLLAKAGIAGSGGQLNATPFHGYYYRLLTSQGKDAKGGAMSYLVNGKMTGGFAFVAFPAEYRSSGVMTFLVNKDGVVYEKDLGPRTVEIAQSMTEYNPDSSWQTVEK
jgi:Protein of unknown function (DUF2950)